MSSCPSARSFCWGWSTGAGRGGWRTWTCWRCWLSGSRTSSSTAAEIGLSVPLQYPPLLYLLGRCLWLGMRGRGIGLRPVWPAAWLLVAALFLVGFRVGLNIADCGRDRRRLRERGRSGPNQRRRADLREISPTTSPRETPTARSTTSPTCPSSRSGPGAAAGTSFRPGTARRCSSTWRRSRCLLLLGLRLRPGREGRMTAATLGFAWAAYPYTTFVLQANSNDTLVALLLVLTLLLLARPAARGALMALATLTKFVPLLLAPMLLTGRRRQDAAAGSTHVCAGLFCARLRSRHGVAPARTRPGHLLRPHDRLPGRPRLAVQHLGPGTDAGASADRPAGRDGAARPRSRLPASPQVDRPGGGAGARRC